MAVSVFEAFGADKECQHGIDGIASLPCTFMAICSRCNWASRRRTGSPIAVGSCSMLMRPMTSRPRPAAAALLLHGLQHRQARRAD